jgi:hypothetical protein
MRRLGLGLVAVALVVIGVRVPDAHAASPSARRARGGATSAAFVPTRVSLFGDSLSYQSKAAFTTRMERRAPGDLNISARPGAAMCDDRSAILEDLLRRRPQVLVLEYSGNSFTGCMRDAAGALLVIGSTTWRDRYVDDLRAVMTVASVTDTKVLWATAPPVHHLAAPENYPRELAAAARKFSATHHRLEVVDTGDALESTEHTFAPTLPCRADERTFCVDGRIKVRAADGLHFDCVGSIDVYGGCIGYTAGGRRFGEAMADAAIANAAITDDPA